MTVCSEPALRAEQEILLLISYLLFLIYLIRCASTLELFMVYDRDV